MHIKYFSSRSFKEPKVWSVGTCSLSIILLLVADSQSGSFATDVPQNEQVAEHAVSTEGAMGEEYKTATGFALEGFDVFADETASQCCEAEQQTNHHRSRCAPCAGANSRETSMDGTVYRIRRNFDHSFERNGNWRESHRLSFAIRKRLMSHRGEPPPAKCRCKFHRYAVTTVTKPRHAMHCERNLIESSRIVIWEHRDRMAG